MILKSNSFVLLIAAIFAMTIAFAAVAAEAKKNNNNSCLTVDTVGESNDDNAFDLSVYASKPWYVQQQAVNTYTPRDMDRCVKAEYNIRDRANFWGYTIDVNNSAERSNGAVTGGNLCADTDDNVDSKLVVAPCWLPKFAAGPYWIVAYNETEGYALVSGGQPDIVVDGDLTCGLTGTDQCCRTGTGINNSGLWILTREPTPLSDSNNVVSKVRDIARRKGFSIAGDILFDVDHTGCDHDDDNNRNNVIINGATGGINDRYLRSA